MKNNHFNALKLMRFLKKYITFFMVLSSLLVILNVHLLSGLFRSGNNYIDADGIYMIMQMYLLVIIIISTFIMLPLVLKEAFSADKNKPTTGILNSIVLLWLTFVCCIILQTILFGICSVISPYFNVPFIQLLLTGFALCGLVFIWIILCACLYFLARTTSWYFIGLLILNVAPIVIAWGCCEIYNINPLMLNAKADVLIFNVFVASCVLLAKPFIAIFAAVIIAAICLLFKYKKHWSINWDKITNIYRQIAIFLASLSLGFLIAKPFLSGTQIAITYSLLFVGVSLTASALFTVLAFQRNKSLLRLGIMLLAVVLSSVLILVGLPTEAQKEANTLPNVKEVASVVLYLDSIERFELDENIEESIALHQNLLELFKKDQPDENDQPYVEPTCVADIWNDIYFTYKLKNGKWFHREYKNLNSAAFDEFYIELMKSDMYASSLQKIKTNNPQIRYSNDSGDFLGWCELPKSCIKELITTYCYELKKADKAAFYESYETIRFTGVYGESDRIIYIPLSFTDTRNLATEYLNMYAAR